MNQANLQQLQTLNGVGEKKAQAIVEYRQNGGFKTVDELVNVNDGRDARPGTTPPASK